MFSNRKCAGKSNKIHLSYIWHHLGLTYLQITYSLTHRSSAFNFPSMLLLFRLCFLLLCLASVGIRFNLQEFKCHELERNHINCSHCVNALLFSSTLSAIPWPFFCGQLMTCTKLSQSTQILICQILKSPNTFFAPTRLISNTLIKHNF